MTPSHHSSEKQTTPTFKQLWWILYQEAFYNNVTTESACVMSEEISSRFREVMQFMQDVLDLDLLKHIIIYYLDNPAANVSDISRRIPKEKSLLLRVLDAMRQVGDRSEINIAFKKWFKGIEHKYLHDLNASQWWALELAHRHGYMKAKFDPERCAREAAKKELQRLRNQIEGDVVELGTLFKEKMLLQNKYILRL